jgi:hypothetical protein
MKEESNDWFGSFFVVFDQRGVACGKLRHVVFYIGEHVC